MIHIEGLTKRYGDSVVVDVFDLSLGLGEAVALWGPNGAGKSTVVRCLLGLVAFDGRVEVDGLDVRQYGKATRARIGYVPQELSFYDDMPVGETVLLSARLRDVATDAAAESLERVGLADEVRKRVGELSGGMKQRLAIGLALMHEPPVLLLDEPTSSLDVGARESVIELLEELRGERCLLLTSHHLDEVGMLVDRVLAMESGRVTLECEPGMLAERLGLRSWLHVVVPAAEVERAGASLSRKGYEIRPNSRGLLVEVSAQQKGEALSVLYEAGIAVLDVEVWR